VKKWARILVLAATILMAGVSLVSAAGRRGDRAAVPVAQYVSLTTWARAREFSVRWLERERMLELSNPVARLVFNLDPRLDCRKVQVNGVTVWMAFPLLYQNGKAYISQLDLSQTLAPVLSPPRNAQNVAIKTICLDPGHGGKDPGYRVGSKEEKKYTLLLAQEVRGQLTGLGFKVFFTRSSDTYVSLDTRTEVARKRDADLFISLHFNAAAELPREVRGAEIFCCTPAGATSTNARGEGDTHSVAGNRNDEKNMLLAYQMQRSYLKNLQIEDRGVKRARFQVLRDATMPAILIEGGFMSHPAEGKRIFDPAYRRQMARAIVDGVLAYNRVVKG
jgi:N-acetylmuramoyl-L-alanine amidase